MTKDDIWNALPERFRKAEYYSTDSEPERLEHEGVEEALHAYLDVYEGIGLHEVTVYAFDRVEGPNDADIESIAEGIIEWATNSWEEDYGDPDGYDHEFSDEAIATSEKEVAVVLKKLYASTKVWRCDEVDKHIFTPQEIEVLLGRSWKD